MRVIRSGKPFHRIGLSTLWIESTHRTAGKPPSAVAVGLFALAAAATLTISASDPQVGWAYSLGIFLLAGYCSLRRITVPAAFRVTMPVVALAAISLWGFGQLAIGATEYRYATWNASLHVAAVGATTWVAVCVLRHSRLRLRFLLAFMWFGF